MITTVNTSAALSTALKVAHAGDTIQLASGSYAALSISNLDFSTDVTITSQDVGAPAVLTGLAMTGSSGITFSNLEFQAVSTSGNSFIVANSQDIHFDKLDVHGSLDGNPQNDPGAFLIRGSSDVSITNSEFQQVHTAIAHIDDDHITFSGNDMHDIGMDAIRGGGSSFVAISGNTFRDFHPRAGEHPDVIQFWTTNTTASAHDITVSDNLFLRGSGEVAQGVFFGNEVHLPYQHVVITGNYIIGGMYQGISVYQGSDVTITGNTVAGFSDMKSWIRVDGVAGGVVSGNSANQFVTTATDTGVVLSNNTTLALATDNGAAAYQQWLGLHAGGLQLTGGVGADSLVGGAGHDTLTGGGGADVLTGGAGDDLYVVTSQTTVVELSGGGADAIRSSVTFTLPNNVEDLELTGASAVHATGNALANLVTGNGSGNHLRGGAGTDTINGGGGGDILMGQGGDDRLIGGAGVDTFQFYRGDGTDVVADFGAGGEHDKLDLSNLLNAGLTPTLVESAAGVTVSFTSGDTILLSGLHLASLHSTASGYIF